jgi:DNA processing protein
MATMTLSLSTPISPAIEMGAYEALWIEMGAWFKNLAEKFSSRPGALPSDILANPDRASEFSHRARELFNKDGVDHFGVRINGAGEYPQKLRDAEYPVELLYYRGLWDLIETRCVAVVGSRKPTLEGIERTKNIVRQLASDGFTVVSGLAAGVDTVAHVTAIENNASTVAVIGTPISRCYPKENRLLQDYIAKNHLLISQVPICRYSEQDYRQNRLFFPERNVTMSALTEATIIVEASDTSGTLIQARGAIKQNRKLFILDSCFRREDLKWPHHYEKLGAIRVKDYDDIGRHLGKPADPQSPPATR